MDSSRALRLLTIGFLISLVFSVAAAFATNDLLPPALLHWKKLLLASMTRPQVLALLAGGLAALGLLIAGSVGLLQGRRWGARLHLAGNVLGAMISLFLGPSIQHPFATLTDGVNLLLAGMIYGVAFFSPALEVSTRPPEAAATLEVT